MSPLLIKGLMVAGGISIGGVGIWQFSEYMAPKNLQQKLEGEGYRFHPFGDDNNLEVWEQLAQKYKAATAQTPEKFTGLELTDSGQNNDQDAKKLREKCRGLADKPVGEDNEEKNLNLLRSWCATLATASTATSSPGG